MSGIRYPARYALEARRLYQAGWTPYQIQRLFQRQHGITVSRSTLWRWCDDQAAERLRQAQLQRNRAASLARAKYTWPGRERTEAWLQGRMRHLRAGGLSCNAIATVMRMDHGLVLSEAEVRRSLKESTQERAA